MSEVVVRAYREQDRAAIGRTCILTGNAGTDATGEFFDDELLPMLFAYPYVDYAPELARVVEVDGEVVGYLVGVADVAAFDVWWEAQWSPQIAQMFTEDPAWTRQERELVSRGHGPGLHREPWRVQYPAEFHIDLLPVAQGRGLGRLLITEFRAQLHSLGVPRLAIGVSADNQSALRFYSRLGFRPLGEEFHTGGEDTADTLWISTLP